MKRTLLLHPSPTPPFAAPNNRTGWVGACCALAALLAGCSGSAPSGSLGDLVGPDDTAAQAGASNTPMKDGAAGRGNESKVKVDENGTPLDENDQPLLDADGDPVRVNEDGVIVDKDGNVVTDDDGNPLVVDKDPPDTDPPDTDPPGDDDLDPDVVPPAGLSNCETPGPRQVRRLTVAQYARTVEAILGDTGVPADGILSDASVLGFHVDGKASVVRDLEGELLMNYAEDVADWAADNGRLAQFTSCTEQTETCQRAFVSNFGQKANRQPLSDQRIAAYSALFAQEASFDDGMRAVVSAMLQSPYTLYRLEMGAAQGAQYKLTPYELASQLSYWLTDAPPDAALYDAAANGRLSTTDDLTREVARLLQTDAARESLAQFVEGWLHLDKLSSKAKDESVLALPAELRTSMLQETREFFEHTFYEGGSLSDLFRATHTYVDQRLASHYGMSGGGANFERVELSGTKRPAGVLGHASFLTTHALSDNSSPVQRGKTVIERLLCGTLPPVPSDLNVALDTQTEFATNRERYEVHRERPECASCHQNMDPIGYSFEHFDGFGRYRDQENGVDIDASGSLGLLAAGTVALDGVDSLSEALADSPEVQSCLVRFWSYYAFGAEAWSSSECNRDGIIRHAQAEDFSLQSVVLGIAASPHFSTRVADL